MLSNSWVTLLIFIRFFCVPGSCYSQRYSRNNNVSSTKCRVPSCASLPHGLPPRARERRDSYKRAPYACSAACVCVRCVPASAPAAPRRHPARALAAHVARLDYVARHVLGYGVPRQLRAPGHLADRYPSRNASLESRSVVPRRSLPLLRSIIERDMDTRGSKFGENHPDKWLTFACN